MLDMPRRDVRWFDRRPVTVAHVHRCVPFDTRIFLSTRNDIGIVVTGNLSAGHIFVWSVRVQTLPPWYHCLVNLSSDVMHAVPRGSVSRPAAAERHQLHNLPRWRVWELVWDGNQYVQWAVSRWPIWFSCRNDIIELQWCLL